MKIMEDSVFTKIIRGELPSYKLYEDAKTIVIIPLHPVAKAHVLAIPKLQVSSFYELPDEEYQALMATVKKTAAHIKNIIPAKRVGIQAVGLDVPHAHIHVIAFDTIQEFHEEPDESAPADTKKQEELFNILKMEPSNV